MLPEEIKVKRSLCRKGVAHVAVEVDRQQTATIVRTERYLTARVGRDSLEA